MAVHQNGDFLVCALPIEFYSLSRVKGCVARTTCHFSDSATSGTLTWDGGGQYSYQAQRFLYDIHRHLKTTFYESPVRSALTRGNSSIN